MFDNDFENPYDQHYVEYDPVFTQTYPFFFILNNHSKVYEFIDPEYHGLAKSLAELKNERLHRAIYQLMNQVNFKSKSKLPEYLQDLPLNYLIKLSIFSQPTELDLPLVLSSLRIKELKIYCNQCGVKPTGTKNKIIENLLESNVKDFIDLSLFFKLNPAVRNIYNQYGKYCFYLLSQELDRRKIRIKKVVKKLDPNEIGDLVQKGEYSIQDYGYPTIIFSRNNRPIFRIMGVTVEKTGDSAVLIENGNLGIIKYLRIDRWLMMKFTVTNTDLKVLASYKVENVLDYGFTESIENSCIIQKLTDGRCWVLNYSKFQERYISNKEV